MITRILAKLDQQLISGRHRVSAQDEDTPDVLQLEDRILYSVSPLPNDPGLADAIDAGDPGLESVEGDLSSAELLQSSDQEVSQASTLEFSPFVDESVSREIVFIDESVANADELLQDILTARDSSREFEIVLLSSNEDGIEQISQALHGRAGIDAVHLVTHGAAGQLQLGDRLVTTDDLPGYAGRIAGWRSALDDSADILMYGCDLADAHGQEWIESLAILCDCDVAASDDLTGHADLGGDWEFEYIVGTVETQAVFSEELQSTWLSTLDITSNLVGHYEFEENGGGTLTDSAGNQNGTFGNAATWTTDNAVGNYALDFSGDGINSNAFVQVTDNAAQDFGSGDWTVSFWYNLNGTPSGSHRLVGDYDSSGATSGFLVFADSLGDLNLLLDDGTTSSTEWISGTYDGTWQHVALTFDSAANTVTWYSNGSQVRTSSFTGGSINTTDALRIGASSSSFGDYEGMLDDVRLYSRELSSTDVTELYNYTGTPTPQTFTVTNTNDSGAGSLRQAIIDANANLGADTIDFNIAGSGTQVIALSSALDTITEQVNIDGTTQTGWSEGSFLPIVLDGNDGFFNGLHFSSTADNSEIRGLVIRDIGNHAIQIDAGASGITIAGNWIGRFASDGTIVAGEDNSAAGIRVLGDSNTIGGTATSDRNVIHDAFYWGGVFLDGAGATSNSIAGNYIGVGPDGTTQIESTYGGYGIAIDNGASSNTIGGSTAAHRNIIGGLDYGVFLDGDASDNNVIQSNWFGLASDGTTQLNFGSSQVLVWYGDNTVIGGVGTGNVFLGQGGYAAIESWGSMTDGTIIQGNYIGTDATRTLSAAFEYGIEAAVFNTGWTIGGVAAGEGNVITNTTKVAITAGSNSSQISIRGNEIFGNDGLGIDLGADGITLNDAGDTDTGGNNLQNWAVLNSAAIADDGTFSYDLDTTTLAAGTYTIDFYASTDRDGGQVEGQRFLGSLTGVANGSSSLTGTLSGITLASGEYVTLVTTDASGNSSEFSNYAVATDSDAGGATPSDLQAVATGNGGLSINEDGGDDVYLVADDGSAILGGLGSLTYEVQFSSTDTVGQTILLSYATAGNSNALLLNIDNSGNLSLVISGGGGVQSSAMDFRTLRDGDVHNIAFTWDNTSGDWEFFVDGASVDSGTGYRTGSTVDSGGSLVFGQEQDSVEGGFNSVQTFSGTLHDIRIFNDVRTANEIAASYQSDLPYDEDGIVAIWRFDSLSTDGVITESVSGNNLTVKHTSESGFTDSTPELTFSLDENALDGTVVGTVSGSDAERDAQIASLLAADPTLVYSAETGKFYKHFSTGVDATTAQSNATSEQLNGVNGQLITIRSAEDQRIAAELAAAGGDDIWLGATDSTVEGEWRWLEGNSESDQFWEGDQNGYSVNGELVNWLAGKPDSGSGNEDAIALRDQDGFWDDNQSGLSNHYVVEWDADDVLDGTQALTYSLQSQTVAGAFAIDADSGQITVADGNLLDADTQATHTVTIRTTDVDGNTYDEAFTISLNNLAEDSNAPTDLSSGIELNTDGGNDAYLQSSDGGAVLGGLTQLTFETTFHVTEIRGDNILIDYGTSTTDNAFQFTIKDYGDMFVAFNGSFGSFNAHDYSQLLLDGEPHHFALTWDNTNGEIAIYIDGELIESKTGFFAGATIAGGVGDGSLIFGNDQNTTDGSFDTGDGLNGTLYDVRIWNEVRSEAEISLNYQHKFDTGSLPSGLVANWQMDGFNGSNEVVDVVSGNNLSMGNVTTQLTNWSNVSGGTSTNGSTVSFDGTGIPTGWSGSQATSDNFNALGFTDDYSLSFTLDNTTTYAFMVGLGLTESNASFTDIDHAIYFNQHAHGSGVRVYQNGSVVGGTYAIGYAAGDEFSFYVNGTTLEYQHNGVTFYSTTIAANQDWYVDTAFHGTSAIYTNEDVYSISNVNLSHGNIGGFVGSTPVEDLHVVENATNGTTVGFVVPSEPDAPEDIVSDGGFRDTAPGTIVSSPNSFGDWTVTQGQIDVGWTGFERGPLGGQTLGLNGTGAAGAIEQMLTTEVGRQYQVVFAMSGNWVGGDAIKDLRASAGGESYDFALEQPTGWATSNMLWSNRSFMFTADSTSTALSFASLDSPSAYGPMITDVRVVEVPQAVTTILNNDSSLAYDAATGKFYKVSSPVTATTYENAQSIAGNTLINGVGGQLVTIRSAYENEIVRSLVEKSGLGAARIGGTDSGSEGTWRWVEDGVEADTFYDAGAPTAYSNFASGQPDNAGGIEDHMFISTSTGLWGDNDGTQSQQYVMEWDASEVLSSYTFSLTDDAGGRFAVDSSTGEITVADGYRIDYETATSYSVTVEVTDATGNTYSEAMTIQVDNDLDAMQIVPAAQTIDEDTTLTFTSGTTTEVSVTDTVDATDSRMRVTLSVNDGVLTLSQTTGLDFVEGANGSGSFVIDGTESDINAALDGMTFTPDANFNGGVSFSMNTALSADLEGHYTFEGNAEDQSAGTPFNGTLNGDATIVNDSARGDVLSLDGTGDFVQISGLIGEPADVTLSGWINATSLDTFGAVLISMGVSPALYLNASGYLEAFYESGGTNNVFTGSESLVGTGWRHVAMTIDGTTQEMNVYLDGQLVGTLVGNGPIEYDNSPDTYIGRAGDGLGGYDFTGMIDEARIYSRALSAEEIAALSTDESEVTDNVAITVDSVNDAPTFVTDDGVVSSDLTGATDEANDVLIQPDGKIILVGDNNSSGTGIALARYNTDGTLDTSFGTGGIVSTDAQAGVEFGDAATLQTDGKIVVVGGSLNGGNYGATVYRYNADGSLDTSFGTGGFVFSQLSVENEGFDAVVQQSDGKIVAVGYQSNGTDTDLLIVRYNADGTLDSTFGGGDGIEVTTISASNDFARKIALQSDGRIVTGGYSGSQFFLTRHNTDGSIDTSFGTSGIVTTDIPTGGGDRLEGLAIQPDGKIVAGGHSGGDFVVVRYNTDGSLDTSFGGGNGIGTATVLGSAWVNDLAMQEDGKFLVAGYDGGSLDDFALVRFNADGTVDTTFGGGDGHVVTDLGGDDDGAGVVVQEDGRIVQAGWSNASGNDDFAVVRYNSDGTQDETFGADGTLGDFSPTYIEGGAAVVLDADVDVSDAELDALNSGSGNYSGASLTIVRNGGVSVEDVLGFNDGNGITLVGGNLIKSSQLIATFDTTSTAGQLVLTFTDANGEIPTSADVDNVLRQITYANSSDTPPSSVQLNWTFDDGNTGSQGSGGARQALGSTTVSITGFNDAPVVNVNATDVNFTEQSPVGIDVGATISDVDDAQLAGATIRISANYEVGVDQLQFTDQNGITGVYNNSTGVLTLTGTASVSDYQTALRSIAFTNNSDNPSTATRTIEWVVNDGDDDSVAVTRDIVFNATNDDPANAGSLPSDVSVTEDLLTSVDLSSVNFSDADANGGDLTVTLSTSTGGELTLGADGSLTFGGTSTARTITGTLANLNSYFDNTSNIQYLHPTQHLNGDNADTITVVINDNGNTGTGGGTDQILGTVNVDITAVNDSPTLGTNTGSTVSEGGTVTITTVMLNETDVDDAGIGLTYTVTSGPTNGQLELTTNAGVGISSFTQDDIDNNRVIFIHDGTQASFDSFDFSLADGGENGATAATGTFNFSVTDVNDAPSASGIEGTALSYTENAGAITITSAISFSDVDDTNIESASIQISSGYSSGEDALLFTNQNGITGSFNPVSGILSLSGTATMADYETAIRSISYLNTSENPSTTARTISFTVNDGDVNSNTVSRDISINSLNDDPFNTGSLPTDLTVSEDILSNLDLSAVEFSDVDAGSSGLTVTLSTSTGGELTVAAGTGITLGGTATSRTFTGTLSDLNNYFDNASNIQYLHGTANTFGSNADAVTVVINDNGNTGIGGGTNQTLGVINIDITPVNDAPLVGVNTGASVLEGGSLVIDNTMLSAVDVDDSGAGLIFNITSGPTNGEFRLMSNPGTAVTSFTQEDIDNNEVVFLHDGTQSLTDEFGFSLSDGGEDGASPSTGTFSFSVVGVNDAPQAFDDSFSVDEDTSLSGDVIQNDSDEEGDSLTAVLVNGPSYGQLTLNGDGTFSYTPMAEYSGADSFSYRISDGLLLSAVATTSITVTPVNDAPVATADNYSVFAGGVLQVDVSNGVLADDFDVEADSLTAVLVSPPGEGSLVLLADGSFEFNASTVTSSSVTFEYFVTDGIDVSSPVLVEVEVLSANAPPSDNTPEKPKELPPSVTPQEPETETEDEQESIPVSAPPTTDTEVSDSEVETRVAAVAVLEVEADGAFALATNSNSANADSATEPFAEYARLFKRDPLRGIESSAFLVSNSYEQSTAIQLEQLKYTLDEFQQDVAESQSGNRLISGTATGAFVGATALAAVWLASGSSILALVASSLPAWASFDPIFVVTNRPNLPEDKSLAEILKASQSSSNANQPSQQRQPKPE